MNLCVVGLYMQNREGKETETETETKATYTARTHTHKYTYIDCYIHTYIHTYMQACMHYINYITVHSITNRQADRQTYVHT